MLGVLSLIFLISLISFVVYWYKKRRARQAVGEDYESDATYKKFSNIQFWSSIICITSIYVFLYIVFSEINNFEILPALYSIITFVISAVAFIFHWWKKRQVRLFVTEDYHEDERYKSISLRKKMIGVICIFSLVGFCVTLPKMTPEEQIAYQAKKEQEKIEAQRRAEEKAAKEVEEKKRLAEKKTQEEVEAKHRAEEKAQKEAEKKRLAEEKRVQKEAETKRMEAEQKRLDEESAKKEIITISSLKEVSTEDLEQQVINFVNVNPEKRDKLIDYIFNVQIVNNNLIKKHTAQSIESGSSLNNSIPIPLIGGLIGDYLTDRSYDKMNREYSDALVSAVTDFSIIRDTAKTYLDRGLITKRVCDKWLEETIPAEGDIETYNVKLKIAELNRRVFEAFLEANRSNESIQDLFEMNAFDMVIGAVSTKIFGDDRAENRKIMEAANNSLHNICETLWIDMQRYKSEDNIKEYYSSRVPRYLFAYDIEEIYFPQSLDEVYVSTYGGHVPKEALKKLYTTLSGQWQSLKTGETITIEDNYENENKVYTYPKINMVHMMSKTAAYAECDYRGANIGRAGNIAKIFLTPARLSDENGNIKEVLMMYANYRPLALKGIGSDDRWRNDWEYVQNYRVYNMCDADDVFIKE